MSAKLNLQPVFLETDPSNTLQAEDAAFCVDARHLAQAHSNGGVVLFDATTGQRLAASEKTEEEPSPLVEMAFSPDGSKLAAITQGGVFKLFSVPDLKVQKMEEELRAGFRRLAWMPDGKAVIHVGSARSALVEVESEPTVRWVRPNTDDSVSIVQPQQNSVFGFIAKDDEGGLEFLSVSLEKGRARAGWNIKFPPTNPAIRQPKRSCASGSTVYTASETVGTQYGPQADIIAWDAENDKALWQQNKVNFVGDVIAVTSNGFLVFASDKSRWAKADDQHQHTLSILSAANGQEVGTFKLGESADAENESAGATIGGYDRDLVAGPGEGQVTLRCVDGKLRIFSLVQSGDKVEAEFVASLQGLGGSKIYSFKTVPGLIVAGGESEGKQGLQVWRF